MKYEYSESLQALSEDVSRRLFPYIVTSRIKCFRSLGGLDKKIIARCHALGKLMQQALDCDAFYTLEFIREKFDDLSTENKVKVVIHELMHIPENFNGDFNQSNMITKEMVSIAYNDYLNCRKKNIKMDWFNQYKIKKRI